MILAALRADISGESPCPRGRLSVKPAGDCKTKTVIVSLLQAIAAENFMYISSDNVKTYVRDPDIPLGTHFLYPFSKPVNQNQFST